MSLETRTLPAKILRGEGGEQLASGWCLVAYEMVGSALPLPEWRGEITVEDASERSALTAGGDLYIHFYPYGGVWEPWHGPVRVEPVATSDDPNQRRLKLSAAGPLIRSRYTPEELAHGFPKPPEEEEKTSEDPSEKPEDVPQRG
jgi:hypothetical protein